MLSSFSKNEKMQKITSYFLKKIEKDLLINRLVAKKKSFLSKNPFFQKKEVPVFRATDENDNTFKKTLQLGLSKKHDRYSMTEFVLCFLCKSLPFKKKEAKALLFVRATDENFNHLQM